VSCPHFAGGVGVHEATGHFLVTGYDEAVAVLRDLDSFSNDHELLLIHHGDAIGWVNPGYEDVAAIYASARPNAETLHFLDPPEHTKQRRRINRWFTSRRAQTTWQPMVEQVVDELIADFAADGEVELMSQFAAPVPIRAIGAILGVDAGDVERIRGWSDAFVSTMGVDADHAVWLTKARSHVETQQFFLDHIQARIEEPDDSLLSELVQAAVHGATTEGDEPFTLLEIVNAMQHLLAAGNETTTQAIGLFVRLLVEHSDEQAKLRADPSLLPNAVEEALRLESPAQGLWRYCRKDAVVGETQIPAGSLVIVMFGSANRDGAAFECPEQFRVDRAKAQQHLAFGQGIHFCVGAALARMEVQVAVGRLLERLPGLRFASGATPTYGDSWLLRQLRTLPLEFDPS
jgi:cytochrome P450